MKSTTEEMEFMFYTCVYEIVNTINNKRYIGSTKDIRTRYSLEYCEYDTYEPYVPNGSITII